MTGLVRDLPTLLTWLEAQIDADEALAVAMRDAVWPEEVWVAASEDTGGWREDGIMARVTVGPQYSPKAYSRVWYPGWPAPLDCTDSPHGAEVAVWSPDVAARALAECAAKRRVLTRHAMERRLLTVDSPDDLGGGTVTGSWDVCVRCTPNTHITYGQDIVHWPCHDVLDVAAVYQGRDGW